MYRSVIFRFGIVICLICTAALGMISSAPPPSPKEAGLPLPTGTINPEIIKTLGPTPTFPKLAKENYWLVEIDMDVPEDEVPYLEQALQASMQNKPVQTGISKRKTASGKEVTTLTLEGYSVELLREVLFVGLSPIVDVLGNQISLSIAGTVQKGDRIKLDLPGIPSSGYGWQLTDVFDFFMEIFNQLICMLSAPGLPAVQTKTYEALQSGDVTLKVAYQRFWEVFDPAVRIYLQMGAMPKYFNLSKPNVKEIPFFQPEITDPGPVKELGDESLPSSYNWADSNNRLGRSIMTSVKDQKACGSCWSFATVGVLEAVIKMNGGPDTDLAEQYLLSCNTDDWSCNGGLWAHDYHIAKNGKENNLPGAVYEVDFPYEAQNGTCKLIENHPYKLGSWYYVGDSSLESVPAIKSAIYHYGPVAAAVYVGTAFQNYSGGVFDVNECFQPNHAIIITGWDDETESWVIKNSWGPGWGENGYMRIKWGVSKIGESANYVVYGGSGTTQSSLPTTTPAPSLSTGATSTPPPALGAGTYENTDSALSYLGSWQVFNGDGPSANTTHYSNKVGNSVKFSFNGTRFAIGYTAHPSHGLMLVTIDDRMQMVFNQFSWDLKWQKTWTSPALESGYHTVLIQHGSGDQTDVDFITISGP